MALKYVKLGISLKYPGAINPIPGSKKFWLYYNDPSTQIKHLQLCDYSQGSLSCKDMKNTCADEFLEGFIRYDKYWIRYGGTVCGPNGNTAGFTVILSDDGKVTIGYDTYPPSGNANNVNNDNEGVIVYDKNGIRYLLQGTLCGGRYIKLRPLDNPTQVLCHVLAWSKINVGAGYDSIIKPLTGGKVLLLTWVHESTYVSENNPVLMATFEIEDFLENYKNIKALDELSSFKVLDMKTSGDYAFPTCAIWHWAVMIGKVYICSFGEEKRMQCLVYDYTNRKISITSFSDGGYAAMLDFKHVQYYLWNSNEKKWKNFRIYDRQENYLATESYMVAANGIAGYGYDENNNILLLSTDGKTVPIVRYDPDQNDFQVIDAITGNPIEGVEVGYYSQNGVTSEAPPVDSDVEVCTTKSDGYCGAKFRDQLAVASIIWPITSS